MSHALDHSPEDADYLAFLTAKVTHARQQAAAGLVVSNEDVEREFAERRERLRGSMQG